MPRLSRRAAAPRLAALLALAGCRGELPGELIGTYDVVLTLEENSCGPAILPRRDGYRYAAELRADGSRAYWRYPSTAPTEGKYDDGSFSFRFPSVLELGMPDAGTGGCRVLQDELIEGVAAPEAEDAGASDTDRVLEGSYQFSYRADPSGRCRDARGPLGSFDRLPCEVRYHLDGTHRKPF